MGAPPLPEASYLSAQNQAILLVSSPDRRGIVAKLASFMHQRGLNIVQVDQSVDAEHGDFRMRMVIEAEQGQELELQMQEDLESIGNQESLKITLQRSDSRPKVAILCTKEAHCLQDLLQRHESGELHCDVSVVVSNHEYLRPVTNFFKIPFVHIPISNESKAASERELRRQLEEHDVNLIVLARYMQILSAELVEEWTHKIINIHHSFLPAFAGASPYRQAHERGVKLIGATAHYVDAELDGGPIIAQDVISCSHRDSITDLTRKGRDVERTTLARAVRWHIENRLMVQGNRVVVFG